jgi:hypothetical protein
MWLSHSSKIYVPTYQTSVTFRKTIMVTFVINPTPPVPVWPAEISCDFPNVQENAGNTNTIKWSSGSSSPLCLRILKERSRVCQKHNCLVILFIAAIVTTCFGCAWPSSGHNVDRNRILSGVDATSGIHTRQNSTHPQSTEALTAGTSPTLDFSYSNRSSEPARHTIVFFSFVHINIVTWRWPSTAETCSHYRRDK